MEHTQRSFIIGGLYAVNLGAIALGVVPNVQQNEIRQRSLIKGESDGVYFTQYGDLESYEYLVGLNFGIIVPSKFFSYGIIIRPRSQSLGGSLQRDKTLVSTEPDQFQDDSESTDFKSLESWSVAFGGEFTLPSQGFGFDLGWRSDLRSGGEVFDGQLPSEKGQIGANYYYRISDRADLLAGIRWEFDLRFDQEASADSKIASVGLLRKFQKVEIGTTVALTTHSFRRNDGSSKTTVTSLDFGVSSVYSY